METAQLTPTIEFAKKDLTSAEVKNALKSGGKFNIETKISENN